MAEKRKREDPKQSKVFEDTAKKIGAEKSEDALERTLRAIRESSARRKKNHHADG